MSIDALFMSLLGASVRAAAIVAILLAFRLPLRRVIGSGWVSALWLVVLLRLVLPWPIESRWSVFNLWPGALASEQTVDSAWQTRVTVGAGSAEMPGPSVPPVVAPAKPVGKPSSYSLLPGVWLAGALLAMGHLCWRAWRTSRLGRNATSSTNETLLRAFESIPSKLRGKTALREVDRLEVPALVGWWRPQIWIPRAWLDRFSEDELRHVLLHELGHARRGDILVQWLFALVQCVHWFNPAVWLASRFAHSDRELACDAWVLQNGGGADAEGYGATLVKAARFLSRPWHGAPVAVAMAASKRHLFARVRGIGDFRPASAWRGSVGALLVVGTGAAFVTDRISAQLPGVPSTPGLPLNQVEPPAPVAPPVPGVVVTPPATAAPVGGPSADSIASSPAVNAAPATGPQVEVESKFFEISESAWRKLGLSQTEPAVPGSLSLSGVLDPAALRDFFAKSESPLKNDITLLSAPRVTTRVGQRAVIEIIREFRYPIEFDRDEKGVDGLVPTAFETRNVGVTLEVQPTVGSDGDITLDLAPQIVELAGYTRVRDGQPIPLTRDPNKKGLDRMFATTLPKDVMVQPLFSSRKVTTSLTLYSGQTVLLGGMKQAPTDDPSEEPRMLFILLTARIAKLPGESAASIPSGTMQAGGGSYGIEARTVPVLPQPPAPGAPTLSSAAPNWPIKPPNIAIARTVPAAQPEIPVGLVHPDTKPGYVRSPFAPEAGFVDVRGFPPGAQVRCPYTGRIFAVPDAATATPKAGNAPVPAPSANPPLGATTARPGVPGAGVAPATGLPGAALPPGAPPPVGPPAGSPGR